jgi:hypothetical protein
MERWEQSLLSLNFSGNVAEVILRLKIWDIGLLISMAIDLRNLLLMPSRSLLDLDVKAWMVDTLTAGNRVSSKQSNFFFGSNRNKPKLNLFRLFFGLFRETKKHFFGLFRSFGLV